MEEEFASHPDRVRGAPSLRYTFPRLIQKISALPDKIDSFCIMLWDLSDDEGFTAGRLPGASGHKLVDQWIADLKSVKSLARNFCICLDRWNAGDSDPQISDKADELYQGLQKALPSFDNILQHIHRELSDEDQSKQLPALPVHQLKSFSQSLMEDCQKMIDLSGLHDMQRRADACRRL